MLLRDLEDVSISVFKLCTKRLRSAALELSECLNTPQTLQLARLPHLENSSVELYPAPAIQSREAPTNCSAPGPARRLQTKCTCNQSSPAISPGVHLRSFSRHRGVP